MAAEDIGRRDSFHLLRFAASRPGAFARRLASPRIGARSRPDSTKPGEALSAKAHKGRLITLGRDPAKPVEVPTVLERPGARVGIQDALRHLQSRLLAALPADGHAVIAVCSALEGEGKTTVAVLLAEMLAEQFSRETLLVDANLKRPRINSLLETRASPGLKDCLASGSVMTSSIEWTGRMWVMPAGAPSPALSETLEEPAEIFRTLRSLFRLTIVDLPSVSTQRAAFSPLWADAIIWVAKADYCPADVVADSMDLVGRDKIVGVVLNAYKSRLPRWLDRLV